MYTSDVRMDLFYLLIHIFDIGIFVCFKLKSDLSKFVFQIFQSIDNDQWTARTIRLN